MNFPLSRFFKTVLGFYSIWLSDLTPNSILMLSTFAYLCKMFVGIRASLRLWRHFFVLRPGG